MNDPRRLPSVDRLLNLPEMLPLIDLHGRQQVVEVIRQVLGEIRSLPDFIDANYSTDHILEDVEFWLNERINSTLKRVINATGVILHTNLGRAPLSIDAARAAVEIASGFSTLEFNLERGTRGSRSVHALARLCWLTGAEDALVVNNNAGAVLLCLSALAARRKVVISRSQLIEIGGGFRIPDVMRQSGAKLVEVGTTNRVHPADYEDALQAGAALVMRAHPSNFKMVGFTTQPSLEEIVALAHQYNVPFLDDLGSGALLDTSAFGLEHEPMPQESIRAGADLVCFSGDKLLGGPQAGIILGRADLVAKIKRHPLARALRADKLCLAALDATLQHYMKGDAVEKIPVWQMISANPQALRKRAEHWQAESGVGEVVEAQSTVGGGSLPGETLPTVALAINGKRLEQLLAALRKSDPALIARIQDDRIMLDPRTVLPHEDGEVIEILITIRNWSPS